MGPERLLSFLGLCLALSGPLQARGAEPIPAPPAEAAARPAPQDAEVVGVQAPGPAVPGPAAPAAPIGPAPAAPAAGGPALGRTLGGLGPFGATTAAQRARRAGSTAQLPPFMIGDQLPTPPPVLPSPRVPSALAPSVRGFKIAENQSPRPQDRFFYTFSYFADVNGAVNEALDSPVANLRAYRHIFGLEKTFDAARGSLGLRLPIHTLAADDRVPERFEQFGGTSTAPGDLSVFAKYIFKEDPDTGSLVSAGLVITPPTGPDTFAGSRAVQGIHTTTFQPFLGYLWTRGDFYLHGFSAFDFPADPREATFLFNDVGLGYFLYRNPDPGGFLAAVAPTFEVHVSTPINHRDVFDENDLGAATDVVNLTSGVHFGLARGAVLTLGFVTPVTGPRPFDYEVSLLFNLRFGGSRTGRGAAFPSIGG